MIFIFADKKNNTKESIDIPTAHIGKINASMNGYLIGPPVQLDKDANTITIHIPDMDNEEELHYFTTWIKELRKERHWTQTEFAKITSLSPAYISQTERGFLVPSKKAIGSIVTALLFWNNKAENTNISPVQETAPQTYESIFKSDIRKLLEVLLNTEDLRRLELLKNVFQSIERVENEIDTNKYESGVDLLIKLAADDFERDLKALKKS